MVAIGLGVPRVGLLQQVGPPRLMLERPTWQRLQQVWVQVPAMRLDAAVLGPALCDAFEALRRTVSAWVQSPAEPDAANPALLPGLQALVQRLHDGALAMADGLQALAARDAGGSQNGVRAALQALAAQADQARRGASGLVLALRAAPLAWRSALTPLSAALTAELERLQAAQQAVGALNARPVPAAERARRHEQAERLRLALAPLCALMDQSAWVEPALADAAGFVDRVQQEWTRLGTDLNRLAAEADPAQLADADWRQHALGLTTAIAPWRAIADAADAWLVDRRDGAPAGCVPAGCMPVTEAS